MKSVVGDNYKMLFGGKGKSSVHIDAWFQRLEVVFRPFFAVFF